MLEFNAKYDKVIKVDDKKEVFVFDAADDNLDQITVDSFGEEWSKFNYFDMIGVHFFLCLPLEACDLVEFLLILT